MKNKWLVLTGVALLSIVLYAGGKPNPGTPKDKRLKENKPKISKPTPPKKG